MSKLDGPARLLLTFLTLLAIVVVLVTLCRELAPA